MPTSSMWCVHKFFSTKFLDEFLSPCPATCSANLIVLSCITLLTDGEEQASNVLIIANYICSSCDVVL